MEELIRFLKSKGLDHYRLEDATDRGVRTVRVHLMIGPPKSRVALKDPFQHPFWMSSYENLHTVTDQLRQTFGNAAAGIVKSQNTLNPKKPRMSRQIKKATLVGEEVKHLLSTNAEIRVVPTPSSLIIQQRAHWPTYITLSSDNKKGHSFLEDLVKKLEKAGIESGDHQRILKLFSNDEGKVNW